MFYKNKYYKYKYKYKNLLLDLKGGVYLKDDFGIIDDDMNCSICISSLFNTECIKLDCNHVFHTECINNNTIQNCPLCTLNITPNFKYIKLMHYYQIIENTSPQHKFNLTPSNTIEDRLLEERNQLIQERINQLPGESTQEQINEIRRQVIDSQNSQLTTTEQEQRRVNLQQNLDNIRRAFRA
jgi:hypothetical protein